MMENVMMAHLDDMPLQFRRRLVDGQKFNAYETVKPDMFIVGLGPISDVFTIARTSTPMAADLVADALRVAFSQPAALCRFGGERPHD